MPKNSLLITYPARVLSAAPQSLSRMSTPLPPPEMPDGIEPFTFPAQISSTRLDTYYTHMAASTLRNFETGARAGVSFLDSHITTRLGFGQSYDAFIVGDTKHGSGDADSEMEVIAHFYTVPGITFGGQHSFKTTDDFMRAVEARIVRDVSVGFYGGWYRCDVCDRDLFDYECEHFPGIYVVVNESRVMATAAIEDAELAEVSAVYDGATPNAQIIQKANTYAVEGRFTALERSMLERSLRIHLPDKQNKFQAAKVRDAGQAAPASDDEGDLMSKAHETETDAADIPEVEDVETAVEETDAADDPEAEDVETVVEETDDESADEPAERNTQTGSLARAVQVALIHAGAPDDGTEAERIAWLGDENSRLARLVTKHEKTIADLKPLAEDGRTYRDDIIEEAIRFGVKAQGEKFPQDVYRAMLTSPSATLEHIKSIRHSLAVQAGERFPEGRQTPTTPQPEKDEGGSAESRYGDEALYQVP